MNRLCYMVFTESLFRSSFFVFKKYHPFLKNVYKKFSEVEKKNKDFEKYLEKIDSFLRLVPKRRWKIIKASVKLLSLHQRAVITANHPSRMDFSIKD